MVFCYGSGSCVIGGSFIYSNIYSSSSIVLGIPQGVILTQENIFLNFLKIEIFRFRLENLNFLKFLNFSKNGITSGSKDHARQGLTAHLVVLKKTIGKHRLLGAEGNPEIM